MNMIILYPVFLSILVNLCGCDTADRPEVMTALGTVRGSYMQSAGGRRYAAFEGIPYAKPPLKKYRFREPRPIRSWHGGVVEARFLYTCIQYNHYAHAVLGDEDCLYVNVYTPAPRPQRPLDVVVFVHGGAFMFGSGHAYGPGLLMDRDVVYVTFNYRLGPFGFLSTEDGVVPGNNGLKDQVLALRWVRDNIAHFGGNPDAVTVTGLSAGGASVHLHYLSPLSRGLFQRGISLSGTALCPWVLQERALLKARRLAALLHCPTEATRPMIDCLSHLPARPLVQAVQHLFGFLYNPFSPFGVVVEPAGTATAFLPDHPYKLLASGQVQDLPWITSVVQSEGLYPASEFISDPKYLNDLESRWAELAPHVLDFNYTANVSEHSALAKEIKEFYLKGKPIARNTFDELVQMVGDRLFVSEAVAGAKLQARATRSPVHFYQFTYRGAHSKSEALAHCNDNLGASHGDDAVYVLQSDVNVTSTEADRRMTQLLLEFWAGYARTGEATLPGSAWPRVSADERQPLDYVEIKSPDTIVQRSQDLGHGDFWHGLHLQENQHLHTTARDEL